MISKYALILFTILLATAAISGCTDADAPDTTFNEQAIQKLLDEDTPINDINDMVSAVADSKNYDVDVVKSDSTGKIVSIGVDDNKGNHVRYINDDGNPDVDRATLNGKQIYPTTSEAESPQTQLADAPGDSDDSTAIRTAGGYTLDELFDLARDDPYKMINMPIENVKLIGLGPRDSGKMPDGTDTSYILKWYDPTSEIEKYIEEYNYKGELRTINIRIDTNNKLYVYDKSDNDDIADGKISNIQFRINGEFKDIRTE